MYFNDIEKTLKTNQQYDGALNIQSPLKKGTIYSSAQEMITK